MEPYDYYQYLVKERLIKAYLKYRVNPHGVEFYIIKYIIQNYIIMNSPESQRDKIVNQIFSEMEIELDESDQQLLKQALQKPFFTEEIILQTLTGTILNSLPEDSLERRKLSGKIFVGEFPTGDFNAHAVRVPGGNGYVFLINLGLWKLISIATKIIFSQSKFAKFDNKGEPIPDSIEGETEMNHKEAGIYLRDAIKNYVNFTGFVPPEKRITIKGESRNLMRAMLEKAILQFVLAHEFGHATLGHLDKKDTFVISVPDTEIKVSVISKSWKDELVADLAAGALILGSLPKRINDRWEGLEAAMSIAGPFIFFELAKLIEKTGDFKYTSHPPTEQRSKIIEEAFQRVLPKQAFSLTNSFTSLLRSFDQYL